MPDSLGCTFDPSSSSVNYVPQVIALRAVEPTGVTPDGGLSLSREAVRLTIPSGMTRSYAPLGGIWKGFAPEAAPVSGEQDRAAQAPGRHRRRRGPFRRTTRTSVRRGTNGG